MAIKAYLHPPGGLTSTIGMGGTAQLPMLSYLQAARPARRHAVIVQTPHLYTCLNELAVLVQLYDEFGNSVLSSAPLSMTVTLPGALPTSFSLLAYAMRGRGRTRRYVASLPISWFATATAAGSLATVSTTLSGHDAQSNSFIVYGIPVWFAAPIPAPGIAGYMTSDKAGSIAASAMRAGDDFYLQLYAHTGGKAMESFEVKLVVNSTVCELVPTSGGFSASYTGDVQGQMDGSYSTELIKRYRVEGSYFTKYQRLVRLSPLTSTLGHLGWVRLRMVSSGGCFTSATITAFYVAGSTAYVTGVSQEDTVTLNGNQLHLYTDAPVGLLVELGTSAPVINTAHLSGVDMGVDVHGLVYGSPDELVSTTSDVVIVSADDADGSKNVTIRSGGFLRTVAFVVKRPLMPTLQVDDPVLQVLPGTCGAYQHARLWAVSNGAEISRLVAFDVSNGSVVAVERRFEEQPMVIGIGAGTASIYIRNTAFANVVIEVSDAIVGLVELRAGVVTGVAWDPVASLVGPYVPRPMHQFASETSYGWLYVRAFLDDGMSASIAGNVTASVPSPMNASITVSFNEPLPPRVSVLSGASSLTDELEVETCAGGARAVVNLTLPSPVSVSISANRYSLVPETNVAGEFSGRHSNAKMQATVVFANGAARQMQIDTRAVFSISDACGSFSNSDGDKRLVINESCRQSTVTISVEVTIGGVSVSATRLLSIEWLTGVELQLFYKDSSTAYTSSELRYRYACAFDATSYHPSFHSLYVKTRGTLSSGAIGWIGSGVAYTIDEGAVLSGSGAMRTLSVSSAGSFVIGVSALPNPDGLLDSTSLTAIAEADMYTFEWSLGLTERTVSQAYLEMHTTTAKLLYASGYTEAMSDGEKSALIVFGSSQPETLVVSEHGALQPLKNDMATVNISAAMCDGQRVAASVYVNLHPAILLDYDIGGTYGAPITYTPGDPQLCMPLHMFTQHVVGTFHFVLRFNPKILECSASSCGTWAGGSAWSTFGDSVAYAPDAGQVDFLTTGSVAALGQRGLLDIGILCLNVIGSGTLRLQVQMQTHNDEDSARTCGSGAHLYADASRCMSRTPETTILVNCTFRCAEQLDEMASRGRRRQSALSARLRPFNVDTANIQQMNLADCLYLGDKAAQYAGFAGATQAFVDGLGSTELAISYNPTLDYYLGTTTPLIDPKDAVYCIMYVAKRFRFVYDATITCTPSAAVLSIEIAGGKVGSNDQAEFYVPSPGTDTSVNASVIVECEAGPRMS